MIRVCFRFDDPSATSNHALEQQIFSVFSEHHVPLCAAVVPFMSSGEQVVRLQAENVPHLVAAHRDNTVEIVLHGHSHIQRGQSTDGRPSEFAGLPMEQQHMLINQARQCLTDAFSVPIHGFVPPWNTFDQNTVRCLAKLGFTYLSAGVKHTSCNDVNLAAIPKTAMLNHLTPNMRSVRRFAYFSPLIVVVFHHYDIAESGSDQAQISLDELDNLLEWLKGEPAIHALHMRDIVQLVPASTSFWRPGDLNLFRVLPDRLRCRLPQGAVFPYPQLFRRGV